MSAAAQAAAKPHVSVIIVSFQVRELLRRCLESVRIQSGVEVECWVVDNASTDGSADIVEREFPEVRLIRNPENVGFARANNQALVIAAGEFLALVNPDTELPSEALATAVAVFGRFPAAGAVGLAMQNPDGSWQPACHTFPNLANLAIEAAACGPLFRLLGVGTPSRAPWPGHGEGPVDWVSGAFMMLRRRAHEAVGGLDESSFMYGEEMDWSWRAKQLGFSTVSSRRVTVRHFGGASGAGGPMFSLVLQARVRFLERYRGALAARLGRRIMVAGSWLRLTWWRLRARMEAPSLRPRTREQIDRYEAVMAWDRAAPR